MVSGYFCTSRISSTAWALGLARPCTATTPQQLTRPGEQFSGAEHYLLGLQQGRFVVKKIISRLIAVFLALGSVQAAAESLEAYVQQCKSELGFSASEVPALNCNDALPFEVTQNTPINDFVGHARINEQVDLVFACRWLEKTRSPPLTAVSVELIMHNRQSGATCFFAAKDSRRFFLPGTDAVVSTAIVSPAAPDASSYWLQPADLDAQRFSPHGGGPGATPNARLQCVGCHVAGPYIASNNIVDSLAQFGLLNDGHDTFGTRYHAVGSSSGRVAFPKAFSLWDRIIKGFLVTDGCASSCHLIGAKTDRDIIFGVRNDFILIPSLKLDIAIVSSMMPPGGPNAFIDRSLVYRWVNMDTPTNGDDGEYETLSNLQRQYPNFACSNPSDLEAHVVGKDNSFSLHSLPDSLSEFNLQDGLACRNVEQTNGVCHDYQTRYMCDGAWTPWANTDGPSGVGDNERRSRVAGLCASPTAIQARTGSGRSQVIVNGPNDRLAQFDNQGLICRHADQTDGKACSNYVVRFKCP